MMNTKTKKRHADKDESENEAENEDEGKDTRSDVSTQKPGGQGGKPDLTRGGVGVGGRGRR